MKERKIKSIFLAFSIVTLLILSSIGSFGISTETLTEIDTIQFTNIDVKNAPVSIKTSYNIQSTLIKISKNGEINTLGSSNFNLSENILVAGQDDNESYPSIIADGADSLVAYEYEDNGAPYLYLRKSGDYAKTWDDFTKLTIKLGTSEISVNSPSLCIRPGKKIAYGVFFSSVKDSGIHGILDIPDMSSFANIDGGVWDWSVLGFSDFQTPNIVYHNRLKVPWITCFIGSTTHSAGPCTDSIMFSYLDEDSPQYPDYSYINWMSNIEHCSNISIDMDDNSEILYGVCEIQNVTNHDLLFFKGFYDYVYEGGEKSYYINLSFIKLTGPEDFKHPQIMKKGKQIYIVAERDAQHIILFNSYNEGITWKIREVTANILPPGSDPKYPQLSVNETHLTCIFTEEGNLTFTNSNDSGIEWSEPLKLNTQNGSVVEEYRHADIFQPLNLTYVIWTDNRNGNKDLFLAKEGNVEIDLMIIPESVVITKDPDLPFLPTNNWINFTVRNNGDTYVEDVPVVITYSKINNQTYSTAYPANILYLAGNGKEKPLQRPLFRIAVKEFFRSLIDFAGIKNITITIDPNNNVGDKDFSNNAYTLEDVTYADIFPKLAWLEDILIRFI